MTAPINAITPPNPRDQRGGSKPARTDEAAGVDKQALKGRDHLPTLPDIDPSAEDDESGADTIPAPPWHLEERK